MLSEAEFQRWCDDLQVTEAGRRVIAAIRAAPPARRVRGAAGNVSGVYPSAKMGQGAQFESHRVELPGLIALEYAPDVLEFYDQPPAFVLRYPGPDGRARGHRHTADFFVLAADGARWEEWKPEAELERLAARNPHRYRRDEAGRWRCPPGEAHAAPYGLGYRVRSSADIDWVWTRNLLFLEDYLRASPEALAVPRPAAAAVAALVAGEPGLTLEALLRDARAAGIGADAVHALLVAGRLWVDLRRAPLAEPARVQVFRDAASGEAWRLMAETAERSGDPRPGPLVVATGAPVDWDGRPFVVANAGETRTTLLDRGGAPVALPNAHFATLVRDGHIRGLQPVPAPAERAEVRDLWARTGPAELAAALGRWRRLQAARAGTDRDAPLSPRTRRDWEARCRAARARWGCAFLGLIYDRGRRGNRAARLPARVRALLDAACDAYETDKQLSKAAAYGAFLRACAGEGLAAPSYTTFRCALARRPQDAQVAARRGRRVAYARSAWYWQLEATTPRHGDRPFEVGHLDHTQLDVELVCSQTGRPLGRPWATFLTDAYSRRLLAVVLAFDPPSYRACLLALRECVRRHGRLPQTLVVDGGKEFGSVYFETLLARYEVTKKTRPGAAPRFGAVCERLFGTANAQFVHRLAGNTQAMKDVRGVTAANDPQRLACWTFGALLARLHEWAYEIYDTLEHPALGQSPRAAGEAGLARAGQRPWRAIPDDEEFRLLTLPTTRAGTALVQPGHGVKIHGRYYWCEAFRDAAVERRPVPVRYDPGDAGTAHAFVAGRWVACRSEHWATFRGRSEREVLLASAELRRRGQEHGRRFAVTARRLADFLASLEAEEALLLQRLRDTEASGGGCPAPATTPDGTPAPAGPPSAAPPALAGALATPGTLPDYEEYV